MLICESINMLRLPACCTPRAIRWARHLRAGRGAERHRVHEAAECSAITTLIELLCNFVGGYAFSPLDAALPARALLRHSNHSGSGLHGRWLQVQQPS